MQLKSKFVGCFRRTSVCSDPVILKHVFKFKIIWRDKTPHSEIAMGLLKATSLNGLK